MCLRPITIKNPARYISMKGGQLLKFDVPCGECAECKKNKRLEWHFRTFHQVSDCINRGGYVLYDTLTYRPSDVPRISRFVDISSMLPDDKTSTYKRYDFMCFDSCDWRNFLKNLRRQLNYHYKGAEFSYFLTSEYGTDERFTHRPHYHVLFFVNSSQFIKPLELSRLISKCWKYGITDGLPYKNKSYVLSKRVFDCNSPADTCLMACSYVAKYITKDSTYSKVISKRLEWLSNFLDIDKLNEVRRNVAMFHRQSQGYGLSYLSSLSALDLEKVNSTLCCNLIDKDKIILTIPLPLYYKRKLYYKNILNPDGSSRWVLRDNAYDIQFNSLCNKFDLNYKKYYGYYVNFSASEKEVVRKYLNKRTFADFVYYLSFYRGRCRKLDYSDFNLLSSFHPLHDCESNAYDWINNLVSSSSARCDEYDTLYHYKEKIANRDLIDVPCLQNMLIKQYQPTKTIRYDSFINAFKFTEHSVSEFANFDKLYNYFRHLMKNTSVSKQKTFDYIEELSSKFKIFLKNEN